MIDSMSPSFLLTATQPQAGGQIAFDNILHDVVTEGDYEAALLSDSDGLTIAAAPFDGATEMMAAMTAVLRDTVNQTHHHLQMTNVNELSLMADDRLRFICRFFETGSGQSLSLTVIASAEQSYRRITNQAIARIKEACQINYQENR